MANALVATKQQTFAKNIKTMLGESKGGKLRELCEIEANVVGESHTFYRIGEATASDSIDYYASGYAGTAGDTSKLVVNPAFKYSHGFIQAGDLAKTNLDLNSAYLKRFVSALNRAEDAAIVAAIVARNANLTTVGLTTATLATQFDLLAEKAAYVNALVEDNEDHEGAFIVMSQKDYAKLSGVDKFKNSDFVSLTDGQTRIAGVKLLVSSKIPEGTTYIVPKGLIGFATWKGGDKTNMNYDDGKDGYRVWARNSFGAGLLATEAPYIIKLQSKVG